MAIWRNLFRIKGRSKGFVYSNCQGYCTGSSKVSEKYIQGQSFDDNNIREYFYYIDHQGQLFLEGTKIRNFVTCFKDKEFLVFFFKRLRLNKTGKYADDFPYISRCGPEVNYIRCESKPIVFTDIIPDSQNSDSDQIVLNGIGDKMAYSFEPSKLCMLPKNGRVYHPAPKRVGGAGILKTSLAIEFSSYFTFDDNCSDEDPPTHFEWKGKTYQLENELWNSLKDENVLEDED
ncbi:UPF0598 protein CG30010-like [Clytia hemisphaerica]|uniref:UPF0598 protein CG30010-like n=1 Tax=Clytia hemisphaerica TaxID=252671 RepID=UPI0034D3D093